MKLRKFTLSDVTRVTELLQDEDVSKWTSNIPYPYSEQHAVEWIERSFQTDGPSPYAIEIDSELIGCVSYWVNNDSEIEVGYWLGKAYWGHGYGTQALTKILSHPDFPRVSRVVARVMANNVGSERVLLNNGFTYAGEGECQKLDSVVGANIYAREIAT